MSRFPKFAPFRGTAIGAVFFALQQASAPHALFAALSLFALVIVTCVAFLTWMRRATA